jgi:hypothetical protein
VREKGSGVVIDLCGEHGTWFDVAELGAVAQARLPRPPAPPVAPVIVPAAYYAPAPPDTGVGADVAFAAGEAAVELVFSLLLSDD